MVCLRRWNHPDLNRPATVNVVEHSDNGKSKVIMVSDGITRSDPQGGPDYSYTNGEKLTVDTQLLTPL